MAANGLKNIPLKIANSDGIILALEERGFCIYRKKNGQILRGELRDVKKLAAAVHGAGIAWVDYVVDDTQADLPAVAEAFGFSQQLVKAILRVSRSDYHDYETELGIVMPAITVKGFDVKLSPLVILMKRNVILTVHTTEVKRFFRLRRYAEVLVRKIPRSLPPQDKLSLLLLRILDENNARNFDHLREIEEQGDSLSQHLADPKAAREKIGPQIYQMKHALIVYLSGLWATVDALNSLRYGDAALLTNDPKIINRIIGLVGEVNAHIGLAEHMSEVLASGLEVLQSIYNNQLQILNNRLALMVGYLTIIGTALLVPNTIATIMSNSMFRFAESDEIWYLGLILGSTVVATIFSWWAVKRMGLLPKGPDSSD